MQNNATWWRVPLRTILNAWFVSEVTSCNEVKVGRLAHVHSSTWSVFSSSLFIGLFHLREGVCVCVCVCVCV